MSFRRPQKPLSLPYSIRNQQPGKGFTVGALVKTKIEVTVSRSYGDAEKYPIHVYRIIEITPKPSPWFFDFKLQNVQTGGMADRLYGEEKLILLPERKIKEDSDGGGESSSKGGNEWDAKTLVGGDEGVGFRDDETVYGDDV